MRKLFVDEWLQPVVNDFNIEHKNEAEAVLQKHLYSGYLELKVKTCGTEAVRKFNAFTADHYSGHPFEFTELMNNLYSQLKRSSDADR